MAGLQLADRNEFAGLTSRPQDCIFFLASDV